MGVVKVIPEEIAEICRELDQVSLDTKKIIQKYNEILNKLNAGWEGEEQVNFKCAVANRLQYMEQLTKICDKYSMDLSNVLICYKETESSLVSDITRFYNQGL